MSFVIFVVNEIKVIVPGYAQRSLKTPFFYSVICFNAATVSGLLASKNCSGTV